MRMEATPRYRASENLVQTLREQGRRQTWVGDLIGRERSFVTHLIKGRRTISERDAETIARSLGVPFFLLFDCADALDTSAERQAVA